MQDLETLRYELVQAQLEHIERILLATSKCDYDKLCIPGHHYWAVHNLEPLMSGQSCLCGKEIAP